MTRQITLGIVDDDTLFAEALELLLSANPLFNVLFRAHGREDLLPALAQGAIPDVLLLDLKLKDDSGLDLVKDIHALHPGLKVMALSAFHKPIYMGTAFRNGFCAFLAKHTASDELVRAIEQVHAAGIYFRPSDLEQLRAFLSERESAADFSGQPPVSPREKEVLELICRQYSNGEIAEKLFISVRTVEGHRTRILEKTGAGTTAGLVVFAITAGLVDVSELQLRNTLKT